MNRCRKTKVRGDQEKMKTPPPRIHKRYEDWGRMGLLTVQVVENSLWD